MMKRKLLIIINSLIIVLALFSLTNSAFHYIGGLSGAGGIYIFKYYTNLSNLFGGIMAVVSLIYCLSNKAIPRIVGILKLAATVMLSITFLVVVFYLAPFVAGWSIFYDPRYSLFVHCVIPLLVVFEYLFVGEYEAKKLDPVFQSATTFIYAVVAIIAILATGNDNYAPYPFLRVNEQSPIATIIFLLFFIAFAIGMGYLYKFLYTKLNKLIK